MKRLLLTLPALLCACGGDAAPDVPAVWEQPYADVAATQPVNREDEWWGKRHDLLVSRLASKPRLVFIGDSITQGWEDAGRAAWAESFEKFGAVNYGISADFTNHVLWRLRNSPLDQAAPELAVLMIGTNNTAGGHTAVEIAEGVKAILQELARAWPDIEVILLAVFPRGADSGDRLRANNDSVNEILATYDDGERVHYRDIGSVFVEPDGVLPQSIMPDLLHLSPEGYQRWSDAVLPQIERILGE